MKTNCKSVLVIVGLCFTQSIGWASSVTLEAGTVRAATGSKVAVPISLKGAQKLAAVQMELAYDPTILEAQDKAVEKGSFPQDISTGSHVVAPGLLRLVMNTGASDSISGDGTLMLATFTVKGQDGQSCDLRITSVRAWDNVDPKADPAEMLTTIQHGKFTVGAAWPLWMMILAVVLLLIVLRLVLRKKPRTRAAAAAPVSPKVPASQPAGKFCSHCGTALVPAAKFCTSCGKPV